MQAAPFNSVYAADVLNSQESRLREGDPLCSTMRVNIDEPIAGELAAIRSPEDAQFLRPSS
ncbi:hypothetical protein CR492_18840 [Methylocella silvestris]|uniref:Uncharacterized protein n=1 Tax=Methylocella silvestris TaxID=199596 RepID=A0A2J7TCC8_METSI|nr:hypothetical protein CR492_18840 [Methylocella silvestris]